MKNQTCVGVGALVMLCAAPAVPAQSWSQAHPASSPPAQIQAKVAFDTARSVAVLYGQDGAGTSSSLWEWNGSSWATRVAATMPLRWGPGIAFDPVRGRLLLFGGLNSAALLNDSWEWDGTAISQRQFLVAPPSRWMPAMTFDAAGGRILMFGGIGGAFAALTDTWEYDGFGWTEVFPATVPSGIPALSPPHLQYCGLTATAVLLTGRLNGSYATWEWIGSNWVGRPQAVDPTDVHQLLQWNGGTGLLAVSNATAPPTLWEYGAGGWSAGFAIPAPTSMWGSAACYDSVRDEIVAFGGHDLQGAAIDETWLLSGVTALPSASFTTYGVGCNGPAGVPDLHGLVGGLPRIGGTLQVEVSHLPPSPFNLVFGVAGFSNQTWQGQPIPVSLASYGFTGCQAWVSSDVSEILQNSAGTASWAIGIPNAVSFAGIDLYLQTAVLVPGFSPGGVAFSNAGHAVIGR